MLIKPSFNLNRSIPDLHIYLKISMYFFLFFSGKGRDKVFKDGNMV